MRFPTTSRKRYPRSNEERLEFLLLASSCARTSQTHGQIDCGILQLNRVHRRLRRVDRRLRLTAAVCHHHRSVLISNKIFFSGLDSRIRGSSEDKEIDLRHTDPIDRMPIFASNYFASSCSRMGRAGMRTSSVWVK